MTPSDSICSRWTIELEKQLVRGRHVLLHGNIHDQVMYKNSFMNAEDYLKVCSANRQYEVVLFYDQVDGLRFANDDMRQMFQDLVRRGIVGQPGEYLDGVVQVPVAPVAPTTQVRPVRRPPGELAPPNAPARLSVDDFIPQLRLALSQPAISVFAVVGLVDMYAGSTGHFTPEEMRLLAVLHRCTTEARMVEGHELQGTRNTLVITAGDLNRVPRWLYHENPHLALVHAERPAKEERRLFVENYGRYFFGGEDLTDLQTIADEVANLTEGYVAWDLEGLRRTSWDMKIPISEHRRLIDYHKFGLYDDPWEKLNRDIVSGATKTLSSRVVGQPNAIEAVTNMLVTARVGMGFDSGASGSSQPKGVFFFVGPTGVGKTELAKALTELVFNDDKAFERFDMSEYKEEHAAEKLTGSPPGFVGYEAGGRLTNRVMERPHSILLFDEIEKAHPKVLDKFLQILEDGRLTDGRGQTAYFNQSAIIFTSNIGASHLMEVAKDDWASWDFARVQSYFMKAVQEYFINTLGRAELLNRLGENIIAFDVLRPEYVEAITRKFTGMLVNTAMQRKHLALDIDDSVYQYIGNAMNESGNMLLGGRRIKALVHSHIVDPLNRWMFEHDAFAGSTLRVSLHEMGQLEVQQ